MRLFVAIFFTGLMSCHQSSMDVDSRESGSMVFSLPEIKKAEQASLLSDYRLQVVKASGDCTNPTSVDVMGSYQSRKPIELEVAGGCDYWLKLEAGVSAGSTSNSLASVYLSNTEDGSQGTLVENKHFAGRSAYRVRIPLRVTEDGKRVGLGDIEEDPWDFSKDSPTNIQVDSYIEDEKQPSTRPIPGKNRLGDVSASECHGLIAVEKSKSFVSLKFDPVSAGTFSNPVEETNYNCSVELDLSEWSKIRHLRFWGDRDLQDGGHFTVFSSLRPYGTTSASSDVNRVSGAGSFDFSSRDFGMTLIGNREIIFRFSVNRIPETSQGSEIRFSEIRVYLE